MLVYKTRGTFLYPFTCARAVGATPTATPSRAQEVSRGKTEAQDEAKQRQGPRPQRSDGRSRFSRQGSMPGRPRQDPCRGSSPTLAERATLEPTNTQHMC